MSNKVMSILKQHCPEIEVYSIDESFLYLRGFENYDLIKYCTQIKEMIYQYTSYDQLSKTIISPGTTRT